MNNYLDHILNPIPQKSICLYQVWELGKQWFTLGVAFSAEELNDTQKSFQWRITKILLRRVTEEQYNQFYQKIHTASYEDVVW